MQRVNFRFFRRQACGELILLLAILVAAGCSNSSAGPETVAPPKPLAGKSLVFSCSDERLRAHFEPMVRVWSHETGATATLAAEPMKPGDATDLAILPAAQLGAWADRGDLVLLPFNVREAGNAYHFSSVVPPFRGEAYAGWGNQLFGLPVAFETQVVVYRADRFTDPAAQAEFQ